MATKSTNAAQDASGRRIKSAAEKAGKTPLAMYADKKITPVMQDYAAWLEEQTGYKVDPMSVQLGSALRGQFQKSEANQSRIAERAEERELEAEARAERAAERAQARTEKAEAKAARAAAPKAAPAKKAAPVKAAAKTPAKAPVKAATKVPAAAARKTPAVAAKKAPVKAAAPLAARRRPATTKASAGEDF